MALQGNGEGRATSEFKVGTYCSGPRACEGHGESDVKSPRTSSGTLSNMSGKQAIQLGQQALRKRIVAPSNDPIRRDFDLEEARLLERQSMALRQPSELLRLGAGGEVIPPSTNAMIGLADSLRNPDVLNLEATVQRTELADKAGAFELAIDAAESTGARGAVQQMITHQMAAAHRHAMRLLAESEKDALFGDRKAATASRLIDAFSRAALTLNRLQTGTTQTIQVQHISVLGQAVIGGG